MRYEHKQRVDVVSVFVPNEYLDNPASGGDGRVFFYDTDNGTMWDAENVMGADCKDTDSIIEAALDTRAPCVILDDSSDWYNFACADDAVPVTEIVEKALVENL